MSWASRYIGLPFKNGGRDRHGLDCWGLVRLVFADELNIELPSYGEIYANETRKISRAIEAAQDIGPWGAVEEPQEFDVAVMRGGMRWRSCHVGIMVDQQRVLHVERNSAVCIENITTGLMPHRVMSLQRHGGIA